MGRACSTPTVVLIPKTLKHPRASKSLNEFCYAGIEDCAVRIKRRPTSPLHKKGRKGFRGYPVATVAFYGPDNTRASKVAVGIVPAENAEVSAMERFFSDDVDVRMDPGIGNQVLKFLESQAVRSVVVSDGIIGCPHEEGIDYPEGASCPQCPYWAGRDR